MANKSIKFKNDIYLDSTGAVHEKELLSEVLKKLVTGNTDINTELTTIKNNIATNATDIDALEGRVDVLESDMSTVKSDISDIETDITDLETEIDDVKASVSNLESTKADKSDTYTKTEVDAKVSSVYKYVGSVDTKADLDAIDTTDLKVGSVYDVKESGMNYAWDGTKWDELGGNYDFTKFATKEELADAKTELEGKITEVDTKVDDLETKIGTDFQEKLVSGTNIKTVNGESLLGSGDVKFNNIIELEYEEIEEWTV